MTNDRPTILDSFIHQFHPKKQIIKLLNIEAPSLRGVLDTMFRLTIAALFLAVIFVSLYGTGWTTVDQLPQNIADQSNIKALGVLIFTDFVVPFEILSIVLLSSLIGAIYMAKGDDN
ncbi:F420H2 dehydrogenase subunit FpoJ [Methanococcoides burtonii]|uniref:F420H2 dehydrogenase subunit FpoJ n=1 Tax=Methanococcoides burtonii TaxID=29291 RepID=UPI000039958C|nr:F420H2 dehydrogenase subunit FpoJ [Methanococcoides burtonii]